MQSKLPDGSVIISGVLPKDAEYKQVGQNNSSLTKFSVKVGERPPKIQGEKNEAVWVNCQCWHSVARAAMGLKKSDVVLCVGKVERQEYQNKNGETKIDLHLNCEGVFVQPAAGMSAPQTISGALPPNDFVEDLTEDGIPF
ncbi:hypothetical protein Osc1_05210 [Hominimerdicola sp. 21CYCFAH17_S]